MNAAVRAVVRSGIAKGWEVFGVRQGYQGLMTNNIIPLGARQVGNIIQMGGTMLGSARAPEFETEEGRLKALNVLQQRGIDALVVIGGNGSQAGAYAFYKMGFPVVGVASTIDNDLYGFDTCIGVDTALNVALEAIDRLKVTASSLNRAFMVEVMGRNCGYLALMAGLAGGAESIIIPEVETSPDTVAADMRAAYHRGKRSALIVVAEGAKYNATRLGNYFKERPELLGYELRVTILGHVQRGGTPSAFDRLLGSRSGAGAVDRLSRGEKGIVVGLLRGEIEAIPLEEVGTHKKPIDLNLYKLAKILAQ